RECPYKSWQLQSSDLRQRCLQRCAKAQGSQVSMPVKITMRCFHPFRGRVLRPLLVIYFCALATVVWAGDGPATITQQPTNQSVFEGQQVAFSVGVDGTTPLEYHWFRRAVAIAGATQPTLMLT